MATLIGENKFCGPFALAYVMGSDTDTAADLLGSKDLKGVGPDVLTQALSQAGIQVETVLPKWAARIEKERFTKTRYELAPDGTLRKRSNQKIHSRPMAEVRRAKVRRDVHHWGYPSLVRNPRWAVV